MDAFLLKQVQFDDPGLVNGILAERRDPLISNQELISRSQGTVPELQNRKVRKENVCSLNVPSPSPLLPRIAIPLAVPTVSLALRYCITTLMNPGRIPGWATGCRRRG